MEKKLSIKEKKSGLSVVLLMVSTTFIFMPSLIYFNNRPEFSFTYYDSLQLIVPVALIFFVISIILFYCISLNTPLYRKLISIAFAISFLLWLQGNIVDWNYGPLDGRDIQWNEYVYNGLVDTFIWSTILIIAFLKSSYIYKIASKASWVLILLQLIALFYIAYQHPITAIPSYKRYEINRSREFSFSKNKNIIILVLDSFQTDIFQEIINEIPDYKNIFSGFTYFRNTISGHPFTETSISLILTGKYYEGLYSFETHNKIAYLDNSVPFILKENGFIIDLYPYIKRSIYYDKTIASNIIKKKTSPDNLKLELAYLYDISLFRCMPHFAKKYIHNNQNWFLKRHSNILSAFIFNKYPEEPEKVKKLNSPWLSIFKDKNLRKNRDIRFINSMIHHAAASETNFLFKYYHLGLPHWPLVINDQLEYEKMEISRVNFKKQSKATLELTKMFLQKLRQMGVYDNSLIFILADHGAGAQKQKFEVQDGFYVPRTSKIVHTWYQANALPLLLVKPFNSEGEMKSSNAPVSLSDIPKTIFSEVNIKKEVQGKSLFKIKESDTRIRRFISYGKYDSKRDYYPGLMEFLISGPAWLNESWKFTGRMFHPLGRKVENYEYGTTISFAIHGNAAQYENKGWSLQEDRFTWTVGKVAELILPVNSSKYSLILIADLIPFLVPNKIINQRAIIYVNDKKLGVWNVGRSTQYKIRMPKKFLNDKFIKITFKLPDAVSPLELNISEDHRQLAIAVKSLKLLKISKERGENT